MRHCNESSTKTSIKPNEEDEYQSVATESKPVDVVYAEVDKQKQKRDSNSTADNDTGAKDEEVNEVVYSEVNKKKNCYMCENVNKEDEDKHRVNVKVDESGVYAEVESKQKRRDSHVDMEEKIEVKTEAGLYAEVNKQRKENKECFSSSGDTEAAKRVQVYAQVEK